MNFSDLTGVPAVREKYTPDERFVLPTCFMGIELEIEQASNIRINDDRWHVKGDGSLRDDGVEAVLRRPLFGRDLFEAIEILDKAAEKAKPSTSSRTSTHIHLDVRDLDDSKQLANLVCLYLIFERTLFRYFGDVRENNHFCLPLYRGHDRIENLSVLLRDKLSNGRERAVLSKALEKYSALNLCPIFDFGSVEFRHAPAIWQTARVVEWINIIQSIKKAALDPEINAEDLLSQVSVNGPDQFLLLVFGEDLAEKLSNPFLFEDMYNGLRLAQIFLYYDQTKEASSKIGQYVDGFFSV